MRTLAVRTLLLLCLASAGTALSAQDFKLRNPGYLGKRNMISFSFYAFPALGISEDYESRRGMKPGLLRRGGSLFLNTSQQVRLERCLSRMVVAGLNYEYTPTADGRRLRSGYEHYLINVHGGGFHFKFFPFRSKGAIAPLGPYTAIGMQLSGHSLLAGEPDAPNYKERIARGLSAGFSMELGVQDVFWDVILLQMGVRYSASGIGLGERTGQDGIMLERIFAQNLMKINFGIGYLF